MAAPQPIWPGGQDNFFRELPVTKGIIGLWLLSFLLSIIASWILDLLVYQPIFPTGIIGIFTYPLVVGADILSLVLNGLMIWWFGGSLERSWGSMRYLQFLIAASIAGALLWTVAFILFPGGIGTIAGPWMMISAVVVAWAWLNPEQTILIWFVLPVKAKWVGWASIALLFIMFPAAHGFRNILLLITGFFAMGGIAVAYAFVRYQRDWAWIPRPDKKRRPTRVLRHPSSTFLGAITRPWREWQRNRRIAHLQKTIRFEEEDQAK